jgi:uncharacterized membrane protein YjdF
MKKSTAFNNFNKRMRQAAVFTALLFCLLSFLFFSIKKEEKKALMSGISVFYLFLPYFAQKLLKFRLSAFLHLLVTVYAICPLLGYAYDFYYLTTWWDDILHAFAGVLFAMLGAYLPTLFCKNGEIPLGFKAFCAFSFSVAVAGLWELVEFSADTFFATDMQKDTMLSSMRPSYLFSELLGFPIGELGELHSTQVVVNGRMVEGYVDLGLIDSMQDIFIETLGAIVYTALYCAGKGKRFCLHPLDFSD